MAYIFDKYQFFTKTGHLITRTYSRHVQNVSNFLGKNESDTDLTAFKKENYFHVAHNGKLAYPPVRAHQSVFRIGYFRKVRGERPNRATTTHCITGRQSEPDLRSANLKNVNFTKSYPTFNKQNSKRSRRG